MRCHPEAARRLERGRERPARDALRDAEADLRAVFDAADDSLFLLSPDGTVLSLNEVAARRLGVPVAAAIGRDVFDLFPADVAARRRAAVESARSTGLDVRFEDERGGLRMLTHVRPIRDGEGQVDRLAVYARDVTGERRLERALSLSESRLRRSLVAANAATWDWEVETDESVWSDELWKLHGLAPGSCAPSFEAWLAAVHPEDRARVGAELIAAAQRGGPIALQWRVNGADPERWLLSRGEPERDPEGRVVRYGGIVLDVTAVELERRALSKSRAVLDAALASMADAVCVADRDGRLLEFNDAFVAFHRYRDRADCPVATWDHAALLELSTAEGASLPLSAWAVPRALRGERATNVESRFRRRDSGETWIGSQTFGPVRDASGAIVGAVVVARDVTERRAEEAERAQLEAQLHHAQKMESMGRLAGGVAHDFNNMLSVIMGHCELAIEELDLGSLALSAREDLEEILAASQRSADLVRQLLAFARKQAITPRVLDLNATIAGMLKMLGRLIGEHVRLEWRPGAELGPVRADPAQIDQILANLCVNARDAISGTGSVTITTSEVLIDAAHDPARGPRRPGAWVRVSVSDDGCGMDEETLLHAFEPFYTTKRPGEGTGLGLSTVYGAAQQNGGFVDVRSAPGQGTTFEVYLPRHAAGTAEDATPRATRAPRAATPETIVLVDDEAIVVRTATQMLRSQGYSVLAACSPRDALELIVAHRDQVRLLITDVVMPEMTALELVDLAVAAAPRLRSLFISGYTADVIARQGVGEGVRFLQKPFTSEALAAAVREALDGA